jgi:hypothetical protein
MRQPMKHERLRPFHRGAQRSAGSPAEHEMIRPFGTSRRQSWPLSVLLVPPLVRVHLGSVANDRWWLCRSALAVDGGSKTTRGAALVNLVLCGCAAYRTQLFLYLKACGREALSTMNLWAGVDAPAAV